LGLGGDYLIINLSIPVLCLKKQYLYFVIKTNKVINVLKFVISMLNNILAKSNIEKIKT